MFTKTLIEVDNGRVWASSKQADTIATLISTRKGGFAKIYGYTPTTNYIQSPVEDLVVNTRFSVRKLYERKIAALKSITFDDVVPFIKNNDKLSALLESEQRALFSTRLESMVDSMNKTLEGDRSDAYRAGHDRCYLNISDGVKVNYVTKKESDGLMHPVIIDGFPTVGSIMISCLINSKKVRKPGVRKVVNSGNGVLMSNAIDSALNSRSVSLKTLSLKEDNFERISIDGEVILCEDVVGLMN